MIPGDLQSALNEGHVVEMDGGTGLLIVRRLADLILPTGRLLLGYPGSPLVNEPSPVRPTVAPGRYPVLAALADFSSGYRDLANLLLDEQSGGNAILFATHDSRYGCYLGTGREGRPVWLVVDCREAKRA